MGVIKSVVQAFQADLKRAPSLEQAVAAIEAFGVKLGTFVPRIGASGRCTHCGRDVADRLPTNASEDERDIERSESKDSLCRVCTWHVIAPVVTSMAIGAVETIRRATR
jgi:hypothetical protein